MTIVLSAYLVLAAQTAGTGSEGAVICPEGKVTRISHASQKYVSYVPPRLPSPEMESVRAPDASKKASPARWSGVDASDRIMFPLMVSRASTRGGNDKTASSEA